MPEGPEIRRAADEIAAVLEGQPVVKVSFSQPRLRHQGPRFTGQVVTRIETRGKAMLTHFNHGLTIYSHNQLYGVWKIADSGARPDTTRSLRLAIHTQRGSALLYSASDIGVWKTDDLDRHPFLSRLGPDILDPGLTWRTIADRIMEPAFARRKLGDTLLDQGFVAGLGNYLRSEILFAAQLPPHCQPQELGRGAIGRLARETLRLAKRSYATAGITNPPRRERALRLQGQSYEQRRFAVFGREGQPCYTCAEPIKRNDCNARPFYLCVGCQNQTL